MVGKQWQVPFAGCIGPPAHPHATPLPHSCSHSSTRPGALIPPDFAVSDPETLPCGAHVTGRGRGGGGGREGYTFTSDPPAATPWPLPHTQLQDLKTLGAHKGSLRAPFPKETVRCGRGASLPQMQLGLHSAACILGPCPGLG